MSPPCQPWSNAGDRRGTDDHRDLLELSVRILGEVSPRAAILENVPGLITWQSGMAYRRLFEGMESAGYTVLPLFVAAGCVGALHQRFRLWLVAYANKKRRQPATVSRITGTEKEGGAMEFDNLFDEQRRRAAGQSPFLGVHNGLPRWLDKPPGRHISLMGNAIVPQVAIPIFQAIDAAIKSDE